MLKKDPKERATLQDIIQSSWVTKDGQEPFEIDYVEQDKIDYNDMPNSTGAIPTLSPSSYLAVPKFGNLDRLMSMQK